jgi:hypothetical protein
MLKSTDLTQGKAVLRAARLFFHTRKVSACFEHGQWWVWDLRNEDNYSVVDAEGPGSINGFDFEQV